MRPFTAIGRGVDERTALARVLALHGDRSDWGYCADKACFGTELFLQSLLAKSAVKGLWINVVNFGQLDLNNSSL